MKLDKRRHGRVDEELHGRLSKLARAIGDLPASDEHREVAHRLFAVIAHLNSRGLVRLDSWDLGATPNDLTAQTP